MLRIHAIGGFRVEVDGEDRTSPAFDRATALLAWLALNPGLHARSAVASRFWPDVLDKSARASLRSALWSLRRQLGEKANGALVATRERVGLADGVWVDVAEADRLEADGRLEEALALGGGGLLPGFEDEWAHEAAEADRKLRHAVGLSRRAAALAPLSEEAHRALMRRLAASGDRSGALAVFGELRTRLLQTIRIGPSDETRRLAEALRTETPAAPVPAQLRRVDTARFFGRAAELERLLRLRERGEAVKVALIAGEAGSGKTRLAARFALEAAADGTAVLYGACGEQALVPYEPFAEPSAFPATRRSTQPRSRSGSPRRRASGSCSSSTTCSGPTARRWRCSVASFAATSPNGSPWSAPTARTRRRHISTAHSPTCGVTATSIASSSAASHSPTLQR